MGECGEACGDNRFEIIEAAKKKLLESTNIESSPDEMKVLDSFLFRLWQMRWLPGSNGDGGVVKASTNGVQDVVKSMNEFAKGCLTRTSHVTEEAMGLIIIHYANMVEEAASKDAVDAKLRLLMWKAKARNVAKMRNVLLDCGIILQDKAIVNSNPKIDRTLMKIRDALGQSFRNCDIYTTPYEAEEAYCKYLRELESANINSEEPIHAMEMHEWLYAKAKGETI